MALKHVKVSKFGQFFGNFLTLLENCRANSYVVLRRETRFWESSLLKWPQPALTEEIKAFGEVKILNFLTFCRKFLSVLKTTLENQITNHKFSQKNRLQYFFPKKRRLQQNSEEDVFFLGKRTIAKFYTHLPYFSWEKNKILDKVKFLKSQFLWFISI